MRDYRQIPPTAEDIYTHLLFTVPMHGCNKKGRVTPKYAPSTDQILSKFLLEVH